jgi:4'-phosphopantetheinyl transferase EntD
LETGLQRRLGERALVMVAPVGSTIADLWPEERRVVLRAIVSRQREFATGRACARRLLSRLGCPAVALPADADRVPSWPEGFVGSISHAGELCAVVVGARTTVAGVGIDIEDDGPLESELWDIVLGEGERASLMTLPDGERAHRAKLLFSAKEAVYKLQFPMTRKKIDFDAVQIELFTDFFRAEVDSPGAWREKLEGIVCEAPDYKIALAIAPA